LFQYCDFFYIDNYLERKKLAIKAGIAFGSIPTVLDVLVSENLVDSDKIGSGNFYWSLPSKAY
jgi:hypothetical protein